MVTKFLSRQSITPAGKQRGLTLIEFLIASALGLIIVAALTQLFADFTKTNREMAKTNSQVENARFAIQLLRSDIVHAGYWGAHVPDFDNLMFPDDPNDVPTLTPDPCLPWASWPDDLNSLIGIPVQATTGSPTTNCDSVVTGELAADGTDVLVVRHAETCAAGDANCAADTKGVLYFQASNCLGEIEALPKPYQIEDPNSLYNYRERDCLPTNLAEKRRFIQNIYFIKNNSNGIPSLYRSEYGLSGAGALEQLTAQELVPGVERFRVELGRDNESETGAPVDYSTKVDWQDKKVWHVAVNRGDGIPEDFVHCTTANTGDCTFADLTNVVAVKLYILARADEASPGYTDTKTYQLGTLPVPAFNDDFKRHVFSATIRINNVAGRRETP